MGTLEDLCCLKEEQISRIPNIWWVLYLLEHTNVQKVILEFTLLSNITFPGLRETWRHLVDPVKILFSKISDFFPENPHNIFELFANI